MAFVGLNVNIAGTVACGLRQQGIEHSDDGRVIGRFQQVLYGGQFLHDARKIRIGLDFTDNRCRAGLALGVSCADALGKGAGVGELQGNLNAIDGKAAHHFA